MESHELARFIQYTDFAPDLTERRVTEHCERALRYDLQAVMLPPCWSGLAEDIVRGSSTHVATAICFPFGSESTHMKACLARTIVDSGITDFDFVANTGFLLSGRLDEYAADIRTVVEAAAGATTKVIVEFGLIDDVDLRRCALILAEEAGVSYVKQSSGGGSGVPATPSDIAFIRQTLTGRANVKASGRINSREMAEDLVRSGASLLGTSAADSIMGGRNTPDAEWAPGRPSAFDY